MSSTKDWYIWSVFYYACLGFIAFILYIHLKTPSEDKDLPYLETIQHLSSNPQKANPPL